MNFINIKDGCIVILGIKITWMAANPNDRQMIETVIESMGFDEVKKIVDKN